MNGVGEFFKKIKNEIPDIIIENCSTGGSRLDTKMMSVTAMSSFSDAHECVEVPVIAANMQYLISPRQSQIWCVLHEYFDKNHMKYVIASGFLGRLCWSGTIDRLSDWQFEMLKNAEKFYERVSDIIKDGRSRIYRTDFINNRRPQGTQAIIRYSRDRSRILVVCHFFESAKELAVELDGDYEVESSLYDGGCELLGRKLKLNGEETSANVVVLKASR